ncbi:MAG: 1,2-dihydroxy-3-keto-5-methylthiopentene dioxygenase [Candidatus Acidiferrales bacterium]
MAIVKVPHLGKTFIMPAQTEMFLASIGVEYHLWTSAYPVPATAPAAEILNAYAPELENYKGARGFAAYDVIELTPETPELDEMLARFSKEHWHDEDEAHLIVAGRGVCNIHPGGRTVVMIELEPGDFLSVGRGIRHWFDLCSERRLRAIRFLTNADGYGTDYTRSGIESEYEPVCLGPAYFAYRGPRTSA